MIFSDVVYNCLITTLTLLLPLIYPYRKLRDICMIFAGCQNHLLIYLLQYQNGVSINLLLICVIMVFSIIVNYYICTTYFFHSASIPTTASNSIYISYYFLRCKALFSHHSLLLSKSPIPGVHGGGRLSIIKLPGHPMSYYFGQDDGG